MRGMTSSLGEDELKALMLAGLDGDGAAYARLLTALRGRLQGFYVRRMGGHAADAEDLVQETLIALHARRASFDRAQPLSAWIYAIARYKLIDHYRRAGRRIQVALDDAGELAAPDESAAAEARLDVDRGLTGLPPRARDLVRSVKIEGTPVAEVAQRTGMSETAVKVAVHRAFGRLSRSLRGDTGGEA